MQWFVGTIEAHYVGTPKAEPSVSQHGNTSHYQLRIYRAVVRAVKLCAPPEPTDGGPRTFRQEQLDDTRVLGVRGPGSSFHGSVQQLTVDDAQFSHLSYKDGLAYGKLTGTVRACLELPPEPQVELELVTLADGEAEPEPRALAAPRPAGVVTRPQPVQTNAGTQAVHDQPLDPELDTLPAEAPAVTPRAKASGRPAALPLVALTCAVALGLWASCGGEPALLWITFMLPTLACRKMFHGVLSDSQGIRGFGVFLVMVQLACSAVLLESWWAASCKEMLVLPLIGLVAVLFPAGLLPSAGPLLFNAAGLALVLSVWCGGPSSKCGQAPERKAPSVQHPGVPRTNDDGSWPRRPPG